MVRSAARKWPNGRSVARPFFCLIRSDMNDPPAAAGGPFFLIGADRRRPRQVEPLMRRVRAAGPAGLEPGDLEVCVCVCVCARARARVCV